MDLLKFMNLKSLEAFYEGEEVASSLNRAWHTGVVQTSYQRGEMRQLISKGSTDQGCTYAF